jgi:nucleotide-binding universal stress UspA family protein
MKFIIAIDGSDASKYALKYASNVVHTDRDTVTLVHVVNPDVYAHTASQPLSDATEADDLLVSTVKDAEDRGAGLLEDALDRALGMDLDADTALLYGNPATELASYAAESDADGVFVGHTGKSERAERVLGSVAKNLVERARCPVTVVR